jgi:Ras GTPase-activating-like protein IQGAP2/3
MASKKAATYGQIGARKLGRHLPRIASGDGDDAHEQTSPVVPKENHHVREPPLSPDRVASGFAHSDDVAGVPGRLRLSRDTAPKDASPLPSSRLTRGLWADTQRHLLQAYEYLCHVGEAQQWIEGCLGEELGFGIVEMEEGLRNGVVLAKLVRAFQGERVVRRIYEVPVSPSLPSLPLTTVQSKSSKLDFRHSDNINYFFVFVRQVGLPEVSAPFSLSTSSVIHNIGLHL